VIDGRLLAPAGATWLGAAAARLVLMSLGGTAARHAVAVELASAALALLGLLVGSVLLGSARRWPRTLLAVAFATLGALAAAAQIALLTAPPLGAWVDQRATAVVAGVVATEPVRRDLPGAAVWQATAVQEFRVATSRVGARGEVVDVDVPVVIRAAPGLAIPPPGSRVELTGRLSAPPARSAAAAQLSIGAGSPSPVRVLGDPGLLDRVAHDMRLGLRAAVAGAAPDAGALVAGLSVGDESGQSPELGDAMRVSGLSHLTAVSGGNCAILLTVVLALAAAARLPLWVRVALALAALGFFVVLVGPQPSVLRAAAMGAIAVVGLLAGGRRGGPSVLAAGVLALLIVAPDLAGSWAFALSAGATAGLILLAPIVAGRLAAWRVTRRWPPALREALALTSAAQLATLPVLVAMGASFGWVALPANLLVMPAVAPVTVLGLAAAGVAPVAPPVAAVLGQLAAWPAGWIAAVARVGSGLPLSRLPWPGGLAGVLVLAVVIGLLVVGGTVLPRVLGPTRARGIRIVVVAVLVAACGTVAVLPPGRRGWAPPGWFLIMCDVGQGDALLLRSGPSSAVVVDTGPDPDRMAGCLDDAGVSAVPAVVLTHFHADHVGGLAGVFRGRSVAEVLVTAIREPVDQAEAVDAVLAANGRSAEVVTAGERRRAGSVEWRVLWPRRRVTSGSVPNNASLVLDASIDGHRVLLTGDVEPEAQAAVAGDVRGAAFDVLKVAHHGSRFQSPALSDGIAAAVALISVGAGNDYGHPAPETVAYWTARGSLVARTDLDGDIAVVAAPGGVGVVRRHGP
jgi:competence protein ComEC